MWVLKLERFPPDLNHCDEGILCCGQKGGAERSFATVKPSDAATAQKPPSLRVARSRSPGSLRPLSDATASICGPRLPVDPGSGDAAGSNQMESALEG